MVMDTQWVCFGEVCECSGEEYSCNCVPLHSNLAGLCICCRQPVHEIDADTGTPVLEVVSFA